MAAVVVPVVFLVLLCVPLCVIGGLVYARTRRSSSHSVRTTTVQPPDSNVYTQSVGSREQAPSEDTTQPPVSRQYDQGNAPVVWEDHDTTDKKLLI